MDNSNQIDITSNFNVEIPYSEKKEGISEKIERLSEKIREVSDKIKVEISTIKSKWKKKYIVFDSETKNFSFTTEKNLKISLKQLHHRVMSNYSLLTPSEIQFLFTLDLTHLIHYRKSRILNRFLENGHSIKSFFSNHGKTDMALLNEIKAKISYETLSADFKQMIAEDGLEEKVRLVHGLKRELELKENQKTICITPFVHRKLNEEIERLNSEQMKHEQILRSKKCRQQVSKILKKFQILSDDSADTKQAKKVILSENGDFINTVKGIHIQFKTTADVYVLLTKTNLVGKLEEMPINLCDRSKNADLKKERYFLRDLKELSVERYVQANMQDMVLIKPFSNVD